MQSKTNILLDSDVLIHFYKADRIFDLPTIFNATQCLLLDLVWEELKETPIGYGIQLLMNNGTIRFIEFPTDDELMDYEYEYLKSIGKGTGESACMAYAKRNKDNIIASSNLKDLLPYCHNNHIEYLTTLDFLCQALQKGFYSLLDCNDFITKVVSKGSILPIRKMEDYDCAKKMVLKPSVSSKRTK
ncbi:MAG: hypothetical protein RLZZ628_1945 [Bacteroidota bacterium]|jgi:hypothetical protein